MSEFQVFSRELFKMPERIPAPNGCLDPRLGVSDKSAVCETCRCAPELFSCPCAAAKCCRMESTVSTFSRVRRRPPGVRSHRYPVGTYSHAFPAYYS